MISKTSSVALNPQQDPASGGTLTCCQTLVMEAPEMKIEDFRGVLVQRILAQHEHTNRPEELSVWGTQENVTISNLKKILNEPTKHTELIELHAVAAAQ